MDSPFVNPETPIRVHHKNAGWYASKGYFIGPSPHYSGRFATGQIIKVKTKDLHVGSLQRVDLYCDTCHQVYSLRFRDYMAKQSNTCQSCIRQPENCVSHEYWLKRLIINSDTAVCDISGETDKRFLVLHHLWSRSTGGLNEEENYVVLTANFHKAFHSSLENGGRSGCTPTQYKEFKQKELDQ
jgi:hypothetical protein